MSYFMAVILLTSRLRIELLTTAVVMAVPVRIDSLVASEIRSAGNSPVSGTPTSREASPLGLQLRLRLSQQQIILELNQD